MVVKAYYAAQYVAITLVVWRYPNHSESVAGKYSRKKARLREWTRRLIVPALNPGCEFYHLMNADGVQTYGQPLIPNADRG